MFEKLLSLLLHAKGGAVATVLVLGASGALVTATVENGMTTVTITQPSTTTTGTTTPDGSTTTPTNTTSDSSVTKTILALFNRTKAEEGPTEPATGNGCSDAAHATNEQVKRVDAASKTHREAVAVLGKAAPKTDEAKSLVKKADTKIKDIRQTAVKAIHDTFKSAECKDKDDEDKDEDNDDEDDDATTGATGATGATGTTGSTGTTGTGTTAFSCADAKACADAAIKAMDDVVTELTTKLAAVKAAPATTTTTKTDKAKGESKSKDSNKGKGHSEGRSHDNEDND